MTTLLRRPQQRCSRPKKYDAGIFETFWRSEKRRPERHFQRRRLDGNGEKLRATVFVTRVLTLGVLGCTFPSFLFLFGSLAGAISGGGMMEEGALTEIPRAGHPPRD